jgi:hypothetical protein
MEMAKVVGQVCKWHEKVLNRFHKDTPNIVKSATASEEMQRDWVHLDATKILFWKEMNLHR